MKKISRMIIFSFLALLLTSFWNKGFGLPGNPTNMLVAVLTLSLVLYIVVPLSKIILLPLNILTMGLMSFLIYIFILHISSVGFHLFEINEWDFNGGKFFFFTIPKMHISYLFNLVLSSLSISGIINTLENLV